MRLVPLTETLDATDAFSSKCGGVLYLAMKVEVVTRSDDREGLSLTSEEG
jgi:hypothetical protein